MAVNARVKYLQEFKVGLPEGPPLMYLDLSIAGKPPRRLHIELFDDELPYTTSNFRYLCTALWRNEGERKGNGKHRALWYKNTRFHRIIPGFMMQGGDFTHGNGAGGVSAFGRVFEDESFMYKVQPNKCSLDRQLILIKSHYLSLFQHQRGAVSMAHQNNSNRSQFFICFEPASWCDGKHVVLGQVLADDLPHLVECEAVGSCSGLPLHPIVVADCGQLSGEGLSVTSSALPSSTSNVAPL